MFAGQRMCVYNTLTLFEFASGGCVHMPGMDGQWTGESCLREVLSLDRNKKWKFHHKMNEQIDSTAFSGVWIKFQHGSSASLSASAAIEIGMQCRRRPCRFTRNLFIFATANSKISYISRSVSRELFVLVFSSRQKVEND